MRRIALAIGIAVIACSTVSGVGLVDTDGDGVPDLEDNCPFEANPDQSDRDLQAWVERIIALGAVDEALWAVDLDGDLDVDAISGAGREVSWHDNTDGDGAFGGGVPLSTNAVRVMSAVSADLDGDQDHDVVATYIWEETFYKVRTVWYRNTDGLGNFSPPIILQSNDYAYELLVDDIDGDGDPDIATASPPSDTIVWYENTDGAGTFGTAQTISNSIGVDGIAAEDVNGDGVVDILYAENSVIGWLANDGNGNFGSSQTVGTFDNGARLVRGADVDGDGDTDLVALIWNPCAACSPAQIVWFENLDGLGSFGSARLIWAWDKDDGVPASLLAVDLDGDTDVDIVADLAVELVTFENSDGLGAFGPAQLVASTGETTYELFTADVDRDGDTDIFAREDDAIVWYERVGDGVGDACDNCPVAANTDQTDDDLDGQGTVCDCAPVDPLDRRPEAVSRLSVERVGSSASLVWPSSVHATSYSLTRGVLGQITLGDYGACQTTELLSTSYSDDAVPAPGAGFGYLVRGHNACGPGPLGPDSSGQARENGNPSDCP